VIKTLGEALPEQQARVRRLIGIYREIGPTGAFAIAMMEDALQRADKAAISGDVVEMMRAHEELKEFHE
jgi:hypothetical protein